jgi:hypothetical protein
MRKMNFLIGLTFALAILFQPKITKAGALEAVNYLNTQPQDAWITQALVASGATDAPVDHLESVAETSYPTTDYAKAILALAAVGENPTSFGNTDYVAKLKSYYDGNQMGDVGLVNDDIWSILSLASVYQADSAEAVAAKNFLLANQNADGGWGYAVGGDSDTNDTAAAIMALTEAGVSSADMAIANAINYFQSLQNDDGGFPYNPVWGSDSDSGSDAWVISALYKIGQNPTAWDKGGNNPVTHLESLQDTDGGYWWVGVSDWNNKAMTPYAVIALSGKSFPVAYYEIPQPTPAPVPTPAPTPAPSSGGSIVFITPNYCQSVEYDEWQNVCADNFQYRNILSQTPNGCALTQEQSDQGKRICALDENLSGEEQEKTPLKMQEDVGVLGVEYIAEYISEQESELNKFSDDAIVIASGNVKSVLTNISAKRNLIGEKETAEKYTKLLITGISGLTAENIYAITNFIEYGAKSVQKLGAGERAGVINSYKSTFGKLPTTQVEWENIIKISNNIMPSVIISVAEERAKKEFKKIFHKDADMKSSNDKTAINTMAYGLRPSERNMDSERTGINIFVTTYNYLPTSATDWDIVRAAAYSGVDF